MLCFLLLFAESSTWADMSTTICIGFGILVLGTIRYVIGSESVWQNVDYQNIHSAKNVFYVACDHYLGRAGGFSTPCPICEGNLYDVRASQN